MGRKKEIRTFVSDFETTVYEGQEFTEVWAAAIVELKTEDVHIFHSIGEWWKYVLSIPGNLYIYFHNLKFDGSFIITFLLQNGFEQAVLYNEEGFPESFIPTKKLYSGQFTYLISAQMTQWYSIKIKIGKRIIEIRDSLKLLPVSVQKLGDSFGTKHRKSSIEYTGFRYAGCPITEEEKGYIANDVMVVKEALEIIFSEGHTSLTIGSCCYKEFKEKYIIWDGVPISATKHASKMEQFDADFPNLYERPLDKDIYGDDNEGAWIRRSYKGGWTYVVPEKTEKLIGEGSTFDVNSLYPSMMHSESGNYYPVGEGHFWTGDYIPDEAYEHNRVYFIRVSTEFYIKENCLPCIQIKNSPFYPSREWLKTSVPKIQKDIPTFPRSVTLTLTSADFELICEHYDLPHFKILDGCWFDSEIGIFDTYINHYRDIKLTAKGAKREIAKLFLNNLYGKLATSTDSSFKVAHIDDEGVMKFWTVDADEKRPGYIPCGSFITSYARCFTIRAAQANYHGGNNPGFVYGDTDSIHCDIPPHEVKGIIEDPVDFCCWKNETVWDKGWFVRAKRYMEHVVGENNSAWLIRCAGMPDKCKMMFALSLEGITEPRNETEARFIDSLNDEERKFVYTKHSIEDFTEGLSVPGKLVQRQIPGGTVLMETPFIMRA